MAMQPECPRCPSVLAEQDGRWVCPMHGATAPLRRAVVPDYDALVEHLDTAGDLPSWIPWPLPPGWAVTGFGAVRADEEVARATFVSCGGMTETDGSVSLTVVAEEPGTGLGARASGWVHDDPGSQMHDRPVQTKVRVGSLQVPLWLLPTTQGAVGGERHEPLDRAVLVGESQGRWLWLVTTPASAALGLAAWGSLEDLGGRGPELVDVTFARGRHDW
jgi:hypothetical protein